MSSIATKPSYIEHGRLRFLIIDAPNDRNIESYIKVFKKYNVTDVVRACECDYAKERVEKSGVMVHVSHCWGQGRVLSMSMPHPMFLCCWLLCTGHAFPGWPSPSH